MRLGRRESFAEFMSSRGRTRGRWGSRPGRDSDYRFLDVIDQGDDEEPAMRGVLLTLPAAVAGWISERAEELGMTASQVVADAVEVRAALDVAPQMVDLVRRGERQERERE